MQGKDKTIINFIDLLSAFIANLDLLKRKLERGKIGMFPALNEFVEDHENELSGNIKSHITIHLQSLRQEFTKYFPDTLQKKNWRS